MKNNKGFTLIEVLAVLVVISIVSFIVVKYVGGTLSASREDAYLVMKQNIKDASRDYVLECNYGFISCDFDWSLGYTTFTASKLRDSGYFTDFDSPIDGKDVSDCLIITATKSDSGVDIELKDTCY